MENRRVPITLITGYLGAGKTTLLNHILNNQKGYKCAVIVNDIGSVNIDAELIAKGGVVTDLNDNLVPLQNGCICCNLKVDLMKQIVNLVASNKFDYIVIEASGVCEPVPIVQTITMLEDGAQEYDLPAIVKLDNVVSVVDVSRLAYEFGLGEDLLKEDVGEDDIENLIIQQIEFCNKIVLNKVDMLSKEDLGVVKAIIKKLQPEAEMIETNYGEVDVDKILGTNSFDLDKAINSAGWLKAFEEGKGDEEDDEEAHEHHHHHDEDDECHCHDDGEECHCHDEDDEHCHCHEDGEECHCHEDEEHEHHHHHGEGCTCGHCHKDGHSHTEEYGINTFVYYKRQPLDADKFNKFIHSLPKNVIRCKGLVWLANDNVNGYVFEQSGRNVELFQTGPWLASNDKKVIEDVLKESEEIRKEWDEKCGDRMNKIVFIGKDISKKEIFEALDEMLK